MFPSNTGLANDRPGPVRIMRDCSGCPLHQRSIEQLKRAMVVAVERMLRENFKSCIQELCPSCVVEEFRTAQEFLEVFKQSAVDLVVLDTQTEDLDGLDYIYEVVTRRYAPCNVIVSRRRDERLLAFLRELGVGVWLDGNEIDRRELRCGVCRAYNNQRFVGQGLSIDCRKGANFMIQKILSPLEQLIFSVLAEGTDDDAAAQRVNSTAGTMRAHRERIMMKLGVHQRVDLRAVAIRTGYLRAVGGVYLHPGFERELGRIATQGRQSRRALAVPL